MLRLVLLALLVNASAFSSQLPGPRGSSAPAAGACLNASNKMKVLVIGANGNTGSRVVKLLYGSERHEPIAMVREEGQVARFKDLGVETIVGDVELPIDHALEGIDAVIFAAGAGNKRGKAKQVLIDYLGAIRTVVAAQEKKVKRFILLSGINSDLRGTVRSETATDFSGPLSAWHKLKAKSELYLRESHLYGDALEWTILCPGRLVDHATDPGTGMVKASLIHGEDDLKASLSETEAAAAVKRLPGSHDGMVERLCVSRDNVATCLVTCLDLPSTVGKSITVVDGVVPVAEELSQV